MKPKLLLVPLLLLSLIVFASAARSTEKTTENRGAESMSLKGGSRGDVPFPHKTHQETLDDCEVCHSVFPRERGAIVKLKEDGTLTPQKDVMNRLCIGCHKEKKRANQPTGPILCSQCHQR